MTKAERPNFIEKHGLWSDEQRRLAAEIARRSSKPKSCTSSGWPGPTRTAPRAPRQSRYRRSCRALSAGYNINVATTTLDSAGARVFASFTRGGGMGLDEMTGSPNLTIVPDPATFRVLPWAPGVGWILCDEYFNDGMPFHFSPRQLLRKQLRGLRRARHATASSDSRSSGICCASPRTISATSNIGAPGHARPADQDRAGRARLFLPLRIQHGPDAAGARRARRTRSRRSDCRCARSRTSGARARSNALSRPAARLQAADNVVLFRTATRQICRRLGYFATFMCRPALKGYYSSGWHLHQSLIEANSGRNLFMPRRAGEVLSPLGQAYLGGLLQHAAPATVVRDADGQRLPPLPAELAGARSRHLGLRPSRRDDARAGRRRRSGHAAGEPGRRACRQSVSLHRFRRSSPGSTAIEQQARSAAAADDEPYAAERPMLPKSLRGRARCARRRAVVPATLGDVFVDYFLKLKRSEAGSVFTVAERSRGLRQATSRASGSTTNISTSSKSRAIF